MATLQAFYGRWNFSPTQKISHPSLHGKGFRDKTHVMNYGPVLVLIHIAKLFELLVLKNIQSFINGTLINEKYGFRLFQSSTMNLIIFNNFLINFMENHSQQT